MAGASDGLGSTACGHRVSRHRNSENTPTVWPLNDALDSRVSTLLSVREAAQIDGAWPPIGEFAINCNYELNFS
jgi:hypothetical protein